MHEKIYEMAAQALSPTEAEQSLLDTLCAAAELELSAHLRDGITADDCGSIFILAAALTAAAEMMLLRSVNGVEQFTAGEVSIRAGKSDGGNAAALRRQAAALLSPFCEDGSFAFMGVPG